MVTRSRIELLGGLRIVQSNRVITRFRTQKTAALLAYLAYYRSRSHLREHLIECFWSEADLASGRNCLSLALSSLRHQLEPPGVPQGAIVRADRYSVQLNPEAVSTDVAEFETVLRKAAHAGSANERILFLADAAELYRGELLPGHYEEWCLTERERLASTYLETLHQLVELLERTGELDRALGYARTAASTDPLREEGHQDAMRLLLAAGQPAAALRQYRELEQLLDEQLGDEPSEATRALAREVERQTAGLRGKAPRTGPRKTAASPRASAVPPRLPTGTVTFLLTDIQGSTAQWERGGEAFTTALAECHALLRRTFHLFGGYEVKETGDGFIIAFERAGDALTCAVAGQQALAEHPWPKGLDVVRVRMALHTGDVELQDGDYHGLVLHHASRILAAAHGGQILCSEATAVVGLRRLDTGVRLTDMGVFRLRDVERPERLFQVEYRDMPQRVFPPLRAAAGHTRQLPLQFTRFVGRERELERLQELLLAEDSHLVTLTGPGGTGKSRLALELAGHLVDTFQGAVWFVPLADLSEAHLIADTMRQALRLPHLPSVEPLEQVVEMLSRQTSLLVLDNLEHLLEEGAPVVRTLLERVPSVKCVVTSRQRLELSGEREFIVPPLQIPADGSWSGPQDPSLSPSASEQLSVYESVQLFIDRAQTVKPDFQITNQNAAAVAELCSRLEGIPLAIELAAARAQVLTPVQMLNQLSRRFDFLVSRKRDGAKRHQTLHTAVDWSYRLLPPELKQFFACLSAFRGGWSLDAAEAICEEPLALDYLAQLRECSLISAEEAGGEIRFRMLETLREFGQEHLEASGAGVTEALRRQHADFFLALAEEADPKLMGQEAVWLDRLEREHSNLRTALEWGWESEPNSALRLAAALGTFWAVRGYHIEGRAALERAVERAADAPAEVRADAMSWAGTLALFQSDYEGGKRLLETSLELDRAQGNKPGIAISLEMMGNLERMQGDLEAARGYHEESLAIWRETGDPAGIAGVLINLGVVVRGQGDYEAARALLAEGLAIHQEIGNRGSLAKPLSILALVAWDQGDYETARGLYEQSLAINREFGHKRGIAATLNGLGKVVCAQGDYEVARRYHEESLSISREIGHRHGMDQALRGLGDVARAQEE